MFNYYADVDLCCWSVIFLSACRSGFVLSYCHIPFYVQIWICVVGLSYSFLRADLDFCQEGEFRCLSDANTENCYPAVLHCNGVFDVCEDGSDEFGCKCSSKCWSVISH